MTDPRRPPSSPLAPRVGEEGFVASHQLLDTAHDTLVDAQSQLSWGLESRLGVGAAVARAQRLLTCATVIINVVRTRMSDCQLIDVPATDEPEV